MNSKKEVWTATLLYCSYNAVCIIKHVIRSAVNIARIGEFTNRQQF
jgi:hypothetical protein